MLRCVLEAETYLRTVDKKKLILDYALPDRTQVKASTFIFAGGEQQKEMRENRPWLIEFMRLLGSKAIYIIKDEELYKTEE